MTFNLTKWQEEGFILQDPKGGYWLGQGPFTYSCQPKHQTLYHPDFFLNSEKPWVKPSLILKVSPKELIEFLFKKPLEFHQKKSFTKNKNLEPLTSWGKNSDTLKNFFKTSKTPSFIQYQNIFCQAQQVILKGEFQKVVPVFYEKFALPPKLLFLIQNLIRNTMHITNGFLYGFWDKNQGILGCTPEILFSLQKDILCTMALAGTGTHPGPFLLKDKKELKEHDFVVQGLKESLEGFVKWEQNNVSELLFPPLKHLQTNLKGRLIQHPGFESLCKRLHPTPALGGYPKKPALDWLKHQPFQKHRTYFGAPFGFFYSEQEAFCLVALRALEWNQKESFVFSGGGWIQSSILQKEWRELFLKRQQVKQFFQ